MIAEGATITELTDELKTEWKEAMSPTYDDPYLVEFYGEWLKKLKAAKGD